MNIKIIFLDVDGVLNTAKTKERVGYYIGIEDKKVKLLKRIVKNTDALIVLTSTWKEHWEKDKELKYKQDILANYLDEKLNKFGLKVYDKTIDNDIYKRGEGIINYLEDCDNKDIAVDSFIILDDRLFDYNELGLDKYLIKTKGVTEGLIESNVADSINLLNKK